MLQGLLWLYGVIKGLRYKCESNGKEPKERRKQNGNWCYMGSLKFMALNAGFGALHVGLRVVITHRLSSSRPANKSYFSCFELKVCV